MSEVTRTSKPLKITVVGDAKVGKTSLLMTYIDNDMDVRFVPEEPAYEKHAVYIDDKKYNLELCDTWSQEDFKPLRQLYYRETNCFLLCYSINDRNSLENIEKKWLPEIRNSCKNTPTILVGTKSDLRAPDSRELITYEEGLKLCQQVHAQTFIECSAKDKINLKGVFEQAVHEIVKKRIRFAKRKHCKCTCVFM